ncbi:MAG: prolyl oligopeptidase family serine peptidase [Oscillospiraceae bacterium]|nr:prolyl oligopeptidase family serine peptidase [Oscillospiraceae bacterium]
MKLFLIIFAIVFLFAALTVLISYLCFRMAFFAVRKEKTDPEYIDLPAGKAYEPYHESMIRWTKELRALPKEHVTVRSFDGLTLHGDFYEYDPGAPMEIMFHGYRGTAERDLSGGVQRAFSLGRSVLLVDQRCSGQSGGNVITFGIREHRDCLVWADEAAKRFPDRKIILTGISMGATTVLLTADKDLPENVIGILADCGFNSARAIIHKVIRQMNLPGAAYVFVKLGAKLFGHFDPDETSAEETVKNAKVPVIFYHGESDDFVPCEMSRILYEACSSRKKLVTIPGAGHGLSYPAAPERYLETLRDFFGPEASYKE